MSVHTYFLRFNEAKITQNANSSFKQQFSMHPDEVLGQDCVVKSEYWIFNYKNIVDNIFLNLCAAMRRKITQNANNMFNRPFLVHTDGVSSIMSVAENLHRIIKYKII